LAPDALVGVDVGTTGVKVVAISRAGEVLARAEESYALSSPHPGWSEQDPGDWVRAAERALATVEGSDSLTIGWSGQMHGLVCLGADDAVLRPAILWNDQRTAAECAEIEERIGLDRLIELTGNRALTGFTAPKLLWLRRHEPETYARIAHILLPKDYVRLRLTGERAIERRRRLRDAALRRREPPLVGRGRRRARARPRLAARRARVDRDRRRGRPGRRGSRRRSRRARTGLGRPGHLGSRLRGAARLPAGPRGARARLLPRGSRHPGTRWA